MPRPDRVPALLLFVFVFLSHGFSPNATSSDSHWIVPLMLSMLSAGDTNLDEYPVLLRKHQYQALDCVDARFNVVKATPGVGCPGSHYYNYYPLGTAVMALPVFLLMDGALRVAGSPVLAILGPKGVPVVLSFFRRDYLAAYSIAEVVMASFVIALATVMVFLLARLSLPLPRALLLSLLFAFGTSAWSTASRALWQHGPDMLLFSVALYLLARAETTPGLAAWSALPLAYAYFVRPTSIVVLAAVGAYMLLHRRKYVLKWILLAVTAGAPFIAYYLVTYHRPLPPYYTSHHLVPLSLAGLGAFLNALAGQCFSPNRGLFVFTPFLFFSLAGIARWRTPLAWCLAAAVGLHWLLISIFADWPGGSCYGPRYFSDVIPIFLFFLIPLFAAFDPARTSRPAVALFAVCCTVSVFMHMRGAVVWAAQEWSAGGVPPARAWDWRDPQFLRGLGAKPSHTPSRALPRTAPGTPAVDKTPPSPSRKTTAHPASAPSGTAPATAP